MDLGLSADPAESFRIFQGRIHDAYEHIADEYGLIRVDATEGLVRQQARVREFVRPHLEGVMKVDHAGLSSALLQARLPGAMFCRPTTGGLES